MNLQVLKDRLDHLPALDEYQIVVQPSDRNDPFSMDELVIKVAAQAEAQQALSTEILAEVAKSSWSGRASKSSSVTKFTTRCSGKAEARRRSSASALIVLRSTSRRRRTWSMKPRSIILLLSPSIAAHLPASAAAGRLSVSVQLLRDRYRQPDCRRLLACELRQAADRRLLSADHGEDAAAVLHRDAGRPESSDCRLRSTSGAPRAACAFPSRSSCCRRCSSASSSAPTAGS